MKLNLYNSAGRAVQEFVPLHPPRVGIYSCGPTVYFYAHIGNFRAYINSDILRRALEYAGYDVCQVMNVTDVGHMTSDEDAGEDKVEAEAAREGKTPGEIAQYYEDYFFTSLAKVNVLRPSVVCRATEHIADMIALIQRLEANGFTYRTDVGVIFDTAKFPRYADFARLNLEGQRAGARVEIDPERRNAWDFALWVTNQPKHIMQWESPWGRGFPGWHIECSAMSMKYLGEELDIHTGGVDHLTVHHTNEIAQSEAATGKRFVRYWMHTVFLNVDGAKMSKSLRNLYTLEDLAERGIEPLALRYFCLGSSYRAPLNFTWEALTAARTALLRLWEKAAQLPQSVAAAPLADAMQAFEEAIGADLNTAKALAVLWEVIDGRAASPEETAATVLAMDRVLGLDLQNAAARLAEIAVAKAASPEEEAKAAALLQRREELRKAKDFKAADALRDELAALGYTIEDTPTGPRLKRK